MKGARLQYTGVRQTDDTGRSIVAMLRDLETLPFFDGVLLETDPDTGQVGYVFTIGQTRTIKHGLGRAWRGFFVVSDFGGNPGALSAVVGTTDNNNSITLYNAGNDCILKLWVW